MQSANRRSGLNYELHGKSEKPVWTTPVFTILPIRCARGPEAAQREASSPGQLAIRPSAAVPFVSVAGRLNAAGEGLGTSI